MTIDTAAIDLKIQAPDLDLVKMEVRAQMSTLFTDGQFTSELVCLDNCKNVFVRATGLAVNNIEDVFNKITDDDKTLSATTKSELSPSLSMDFVGVNITVSNFENSNFEVERGFSLEAAGIIEEENSNLEAKVSTARGEAAS